jgi:hypothetical protein
MRELIIARLTDIINYPLGGPIPRYFDCAEEDCIADAEELSKLTDEELLEAFEATIGFDG